MCGYAGNPPLPCNLAQESLSARAFPSSAGMVATASGELKEGGTFFNEEGTVGQNGAGTGTEPVAKGTRKGESHAGICFVSLHKLLFQGQASCVRKEDQQLQHSWEM